MNSETASQKSAETTAETTAETAPKTERTEQASPTPRTFKGKARKGNVPKGGAREHKDAVMDGAVDVAEYADSAEELTAQLTELTARNAQLDDELLRARAEVENIRRRADHKIIAERKVAIEGFAKELLEVRDSLDRAATVELAEDAAEAVHTIAVQKMGEGLSLTLKQFDIALAKFAVVEVDAAPGTRFDPACHQAISTAPSEEFAADHIIAVVQKGFLLKERLLRPAMVVVAAGG